MKGYLDAKELESYKKEDLQELAKQLVNRGKARLTHCYSRKSNRYYDPTVHVETGEDGAAAFKLEFGGKK